MRKCEEFILAGMKTQWGEGGGRILLGDNAGVVAVMLRPIRLHCVGVWISSGLICACKFYHMNIQFHFAPGVPERNCCVSRSVSV